MPRGPGQKKNYNLDYSRFNYLDKNAFEQEAATDEIRETPPVPDGMPDMRDMMRSMPPELQEAHHLLSMARANGDKDAERRANELALKAIENGGPQVKKDFIETLSKHEPAAAKALAVEMGVTQSDPDTAAGKCEGLANQIDFLKDRMEKGAEQARQQMQSLERQQEQVDKLAQGGPEDFMKFMKEQGLDEMDMQRIFGGDTSHMENKLQGMLDKAVKPGKDGRIEDPEATVKAAEELHRSICGETDSGDKLSDEPVIEDLGEEPIKAPARKVVAKVDEPKIADHRLQYQKDDAGQYISVELKCTLPGVADMSSIMLDVSEKHIRLNTCAPGPRYVVNAGPFPVLIEPGAARAKFSKKRQELSISVAPKAN